MNLHKMGSLRIESGQLRIQTTRVKHYHHRSDVKRAASVGVLVKFVNAKTGLVQTVETHSGRLNPL